MESLIVPWSEEMSAEEQSYKARGFVKTKASIFTILEPSVEELMESFNMKKCNNIKGQDVLSIGAIALCSHSTRSQYYPKMIGTVSDKNKIASDYFAKFIKTKINWKNIHNVNGRIVYEIRNVDAYGMRWYLDKDLIVFRGLLEPYPTYLEYKNK